MLIYFFLNFSVQYCIAFFAHCTCVLHLVAIVLLLQKFQTVSQVASVRATTGICMAADLLHGMYDTTFLAAHTQRRELGERSSWSSICCCTDRYAV